MAGIEYMTVGVVAERRRIEGNAWVDHAWAPVAILPDAPALPDWTLLRAEGGVERWYVGSAALSFFPSDTGNLIENFVPGAQKIWVSIRPTGIEPPLEVIGVTAEPGEGEILAEGIGDIVDVVPMPDLVAERIVDFYRRNHVERPFVKRQRDGKGKAAREREQGRGPGDGERQ